MVQEHCGNGKTATEEAIRQLRCVAPIPRHEIEQVAYELGKTSSSAKGQELVQLIMEAALKQWISGVGCC